MNYDYIKYVALMYADRFDTQTVNMIPYFTQVVESRINRLLVIEDMSKRYAFPEPNPADGYYNLPADFSAIQDIAIVNIASMKSWSSLDQTTWSIAEQSWYNLTGSWSGRVTLSLVSPEQMNEVQGSPSKRPAKFYCILGNQLIVQPIPIDGVGSLEIVYYGGIVPLVNPTDSNWISVNHPDLYINGLVEEINAYVKDAEASALWNARFMQVIQELMEADNVLVYSGTALQTRLG